jgi:hypothetical protein
MPLSLSSPEALGEGMDTPMLDEKKVYCASSKVRERFLGGTVEKA